MFTGTTFEKAVEAFSQGKEVLCLDRNTCSFSGKGYSVFDFADLADGLEFLVNVPESQVLSQAVLQDMIVEAVHETQDEDKPEGESETDTPQKKREKKMQSRERAVELSEKGMSIAEVAKELGISYGTVYGWIRKPKTKNKDGVNADRHLCKTCQYRAGSAMRNSVGANCNYLGIVGHSRGCAPEECTVYVKGKRIDDREPMSIK